MKMNKMRCAGLVILAVLVITAGGYCYNAEVTDISGRKYFPAVKEAFSKAKKSINIVMFLIEVPSQKKKLKAEQLVDALIEARARGVDVEVILDQNVDFVRRRSSSDWEAKVKSIRAYKLMKGAGIRVYYDEPVRYTHAKAIVIDGKTIILGSTNWTESSLNKSNEVNVLIRSKGLARDVTSYIRAIKRDENIESYLDFTGSSIAISRDFVEDPLLAPRMVKARDERAFDTYLYLLERFSGNARTKLALSYESIAEYLGIYHGWARLDYRRQIIKTLRKLQDRYKLITFQTGYGKEATITLKAQEGEEDSFRLPDDYFIFGWNRNLSLRAKLCYLISLANSDVSDSKPFWSKGVNSIARQFGGVSPDVIKTGMGELRRARLIEVKYDTLTGKPYCERLPKMYKTLSLYDPAELNSKLKGMEARYGKAAYARARRYAGLVFEENNPAVIEDIILKTERYGEKTVKKSFDIIAKKNIDNPKRTYNYTAGIIEKAGEE